MDLEALKLIARFSLSPNKLGYCGLDSAEARFRKCILEDKTEGVAEEVEHFIVLNPYLNMLAKVLGKDKLSKEVVEAYWMGNQELEKVTAPDYEILLKNFTKQGVPKWLVEELKNKRPKKFIPTHLFQVLHVGVGKASGSVPFSIETINNCMVRWGKVIRKCLMTNDKCLMIDLNSLDINEGKYKLKTITEEIKVDETLNPEVKIGDTVAVHWGWVTKKLTAEEQQKIEYWTKAVLENITRQHSEP